MDRLRKSFFHFILRILRIGKLMGSGGLRGLQNRWLHTSQRQVRFLPLPILSYGCVASC